MKQLTYADVPVGSEIPPLIKPTSIQMMVRWAGAQGDDDRIHYDKEYAVSRNLPNIVVNGRLKAFFLAQMMTDWIGEKGVLSRIRCQYRGVDIVGEPIACRGKVVKQYVQEDKHYIECEIWTENPRGERTTLGSSTAILPGP